MNPRCTRLLNRLRTTLVVFCLGTLMLTLPGCGGVKIASKGAKLASKGAKTIKGASKTTKAAKTGAVATKGALADDAFRQSGKLADNALLTADDAARGSSKSAKQSDEIESAIYDFGDQALQYVLKNNQQTLTLDQRRKLVLERQNASIQHLKDWQIHWMEIRVPGNPVFEAWSAIEQMSPNNPERKKLSSKFEQKIHLLLESTPNSIDGWKLAKSFHNIAKKARTRR
jgi:hypothetical protein